MRLRTVLFASWLLATANPAYCADTPSTAELWEIVRAQQQTIDELKTRLDAATATLERTSTKIEKTEQQVAETDAKVEAAADAMEVAADGAGGSARQGQRTVVGGYGELHYNNLEDDATSSDGAPDDLDQVDLHRFVLFLGHEFTDSIRFFSELEVEHSFSGDGAPGEVELEQAWIEMDVNPRHRLRAGLDILPIGIINQTHEPNTFYGVERNPVETEIIPATWWEAGLALMGELAPGFNYDLALHSGLSVPTAGSSAFRPRSGRLKVAEANDQDVAVTGRIRYTGVPGLELAMTGQYQADYTGTADAADVGAFLFETHLDWRHNSGAGVRALYARWDLDSDPAAGVDPGVFGADTLEGWYVEPSYRFVAPLMVPGEFGIFARYSEWDQRNQLVAALQRFERFDRIDTGLNYWPTGQVVFKFDVQWEDAAGRVDRLLDGFNLGMGYQF